MIIILRAEGLINILSGHKLGRDVRFTSYAAGHLLLWLEKRCFAYNP